jgi:hypothetical protein
MTFPVIRSIATIGVLGRIQLGRCDALLASGRKILQGPMVPRGEVKAEPTAPYIFARDAKLIILRVPIGILPNAHLQSAASSKSHAAVAIGPMTLSVRLATMKSTLISTTVGKSIFVRWPDAR